MLTVYSAYIPNVVGDYTTRDATNREIVGQLFASMRKPDIVFLQNVSSELHKLLLSVPMLEFSIKQCTGVCVIANGKRIICPPGYQVRDGEKVLNSQYKINLVTLLARRRFQWVSNEGPNCAIVDELNGERSQIMPIYDNLRDRYIITCNVNGLADIAPIKLFKKKKTRPRDYGWIAAIYTRGTKFDASYDFTTKKHNLAIGTMHIELHELEIV